MATTTPDIFTHVHDEEILEDDKLQSFNEETYRKIVHNNNWLIDLRPVGSVMVMNTNQQNVTLPSNAVWQLCNGGEITHPESPLRSIGEQRNNVPNYTDRYMRIGANSGEFGGSNIHNLQHNHITGPPDNLGPTIQDKGDRRYRTVHGHHVAVQYDTAAYLDSPAYYYVNLYMKIV